MMKIGAVLLLLVVLLAACGGDDQDDVESTSSDSVVEDFEAPSDGGSLVGVDLEIPDWFAPGFGFTDDMSIRQVYGDDQQLSLYATSDADVATVHTNAVSGLTEAGYDLMSDQENFAVFARDGLGRVRVRTSEGSSGGSEVSVDIDLWTDEQIEEFRILTAPQVTTAGTATSTLDGVSTDVEGECIVQGRNYIFVGSDGLVSASVNEFAEPPTVDASLTADNILYYMPIGGDRDYVVDEPVSPVRFSVSGVTVAPDGSDPDAEYELSVDVVCEG